MNGPLKVLGLGGDHIGPEVVDSGLQVLRQVARQFDVAVDIEEDLLGTASWDAHGNAPDISGQGIANPLGAILSVAMMFEHGLGRPEAADAIERAVDNFLNAGLLPPDLGGSADTTTVTQAVLRNLRTDEP